VGKCETISASPLHEKKKKKSQLLLREEGATGSDNCVNKKACKSRSHLEAGREDSATWSCASLLGLRQSHDATKIKGDKLSQGQRSKHCN